MRTFNLDTFLEDKSLGKIIDIFNEAYNNVSECSIELTDIAENREKIEAEEGGSIENAEKTLKHFYYNAYDAMTMAFHRIVGLELFAMDSDCEDERILAISPEEQEKYDIPFDSIHELCIEGNIWFTKGEDSYDDDELDAINMRNVVKFLNEM